MTLYWWMHWFWITTLNPCVLVLFLFWGSVVQSLSLPFIPVVQNGHQNGPYITKHPSDTTSKIGLFNLKLNYANNYPTANYQEIAHYSTDDLSTTEENVFKHLLSKDELETPASLQDGTVPTSDTPVLLHFPLKIPPNRNENENFPLPDTNDNDDTISSLTGVDDVQSVGSTQSDAAQTKALGDEPMSDEPFNPTGSFINSTNVRSKSNSKPTSSILKSTTVKSDFILTSDKPLIGHRSKTVNREKTIQERNQAAAVLQNEMVPILYVTPNSLNDSVEFKNEGTDISTNSSDWNNATSVLSDDTMNVRNVDSWDNRTEIVKSLASINDKVIPVSKERVGEVVKQEGLNAASVTGIALGIMSSAGFIVGLSFVLYRRRYLNKPQTLNDSNPDSIGYLDDSTLRENSEEMYSLDNDSFLNSLEAMTIQNYWTDSVKHTKL